MTHETKPFPRLGAAVTASLEAARLSKKRAAERSGLFRPDVTNVANGLHAPGPTWLQRLATGIKRPQDLDGWLEAKRLDKDAGAPGGSADEPGFRDRESDRRAPVAVPLHDVPGDAGGPRGGGVAGGAGAGAAGGDRVAANEDVEAFRRRILARVERLVAHVEAELEAIKRAVTPPCPVTVAPLTEQWAA